MCVRNMTLSFVIIVIIVIFLASLRWHAAILCRMLLIVGFGLVEDLLILVLLDPAALLPLREQVARGFLEVGHRAALSLVEHFKLLTCERVTQLFQQASHTRAHDSVVLFEFRADFLAEETHLHPEVIVERPGHEVLDLLSPLHAVHDVEQNALSEGDLNGPIRQLPVTLVAHHQRALLTSVEQGQSQFLGLRTDDEPLGILQPCLIDGQFLVESLVVAFEQMTNMTNDSVILGGGCCHSILFYGVGFSSGSLAIMGSNSYVSEVV